MAKDLAYCSCPIHWNYATQLSGHNLSLMYFCYFMN